ncbi:MAG: iron-containing alcohol dehydrogenase, partial [Paludibacteraceae bacterium]|nr:iron-containing alcohol dehydrogenase [Paludibacteraceae bacterium]
LASVSMAYYRHAMEKGLPKFVRFAQNVWGIQPSSFSHQPSDREIAEAGLEALRNWMQEIGLPLTISEIGATPDMIDNIVSTTVLFPAGYLDLTAEDVKEILKESL